MPVCVCGVFLSAAVLFSVELNILLSTAQSVVEIDRVSLDVNLDCSPMSR